MFVAFEKWADLLLHPASGRLSKKLSHCADLAHLTQIVFVNLHSV
jgi:hypothetical protein